MLLLLAFVLFLGFLFHQLYWRTRNMPPGPTPLPLLGNLHSILWEYPGQAPMWRWKERFGSIYTYWLGTVPIVTVNDYKTIQEMFVADGDNYVDRSAFSSFTEEYRGGVLGIIETSGDVWREQRRFALHTLRDFGLGKEAMQERILNEALLLLDTLEFEARQTGITSPIAHIEQSVASVINLVIFGYRFDEEHLHELRASRAVQDEFIAASKNPLVLLPITFKCLRSAWPFASSWERVQRMRAEQFGFFEKNIELHRARIDYSNDECDDFCDAYLKEMRKREEAGEKDSSFHEQQFVNVCLDLWSAGLDTTAMTMSWGILYLIHNPEVQAKLHEEYDRVIGSDRLITVADKSALPYTQAYINELQRHANIVSQNLLRKSGKEVTVNGVLIPAGTTICPQVSNLMVDPEIFPSPETFDPSRFIDADGKLITVKQLMPFSVGRRQCPGEGLARMELFLFFANLAHRFKISPEDPENLPTLAKTLKNVTRPEPFAVRLERRQ